MADSKAARKAALEAIEVNASQAQFRLSKLGEALHVLQDSWANQGVPTLPQLGDAISTCDSRLVWGHSETRGGPASHRADLTMYWPADTVAMAQATYEILKQYPSISGTRRSPRDWHEIRAELDGFINASTKTEKAHWFAAHGINDVSFLEGISLPDGAEPFLQHWPGRKLPPLSTEKSRQHAVDAGLLDFYNRFFARWLATDDFVAVVAEFSQAPDTSEGTATTSMSREELESRTQALATARPRPASLKLLFAVNRSPQSSAPRSMRLQTAPMPMSATHPYRPRTTLFFRRSVMMYLLCYLFLSAWSLPMPGIHRRSR